MKLRIFAAFAIAATIVTLESAAQTAPPKLDIPINLKPYFLVLIKKGPNYKKPGTPEAMKLIAGHLAWIKKLNAEKKLLLAGPTGDGNYLGMAVLDVPTEAAARKLMAAEPEVVAKAMSYDLQSIRLPDLDPVRIEYAK